jgi:hypothetical protein
MQAVANKYAVERFQNPAKPLVVSDVRNAFYENYGMPFLPAGVSSFVSEMLSGITMALAGRAQPFAYSRVFALGLTTLCKYFISEQEVPDEEKRGRIEKSMMIALGLDPAEITGDAEALSKFASESTEEQLLASEDFKQIAAASDYKYTYQLGAGLLALMPLVGVEENDATIDRWCDALGLRGALLKKDAAYFKSIQNKMAEMKEMLLQMQAGEKRKQAARLKEEAEAAAKAAEDVEKASTEEKK